MFERIISALYTDPWLILPSRHRAMGQALNAYLRERPAVALPQQSQRTDSKPPRGVNIVDGVAELRVHGVLGKHLDMMEVECGGGYDVALLERQMVELSTRDDVHTILALFNSPGGHASGMHELAGFIQEVGAEKRTVAMIDNTGCSGAYYLACGFGEIYATPTASVGSIGCYCALVDDSRAWEQEGYVMELFKSGEGKGRGMPGKALSDEDRAFFQASVDTIGSRFRGFVKARRPGVTDASLNGDYWDADEAAARGLIDGTYATPYHLAADLLTPAR